MVSPETPRRAHEQGSAYIVTLLALLVLTLGGLSVALVTQSEMQIGMNEKGNTRSFYAAESGLNLTIAYMLTVGGRCFPQQDGEQLEDGWELALDVENVEGDPANPQRFADRVSVAPALILFRGCCNWCPCQEGTKSDIHRYNYGLIAEAERITFDSANIPPDDEVPGREIPDRDYGVLVRKSVGTILDIQPFGSSGFDSCLAIDPAALERYKF